mmetsp:Transcript_30776/g.55856  ORF Transcript_30776/g.55856 Transcript_30776/m.55856 type:complete len:112 (+) Transcript_30776:1248-1583(+)
MASLLGVLSLVLPPLQLLLKGRCLQLLLSKGSSQKVASEAWQRLAFEVEMAQSSKFPELGSVAGCAAVMKLAVKVACLAIENFAQTPGAVCHQSCSSLTGNQVKADPIVRA